MMKFMNYNLYIFDNFNSVTNHDVQFLFNFMPKNRKIRAENCFYKIDKKIKTIEYFVLKQALGFKGVKELKYLKNGKPIIYDCKKFNISHTRTALVVAVSDDNIGVDIQEVITYREDLAKYICSKKEYEIISKSDKPSIELTKLWVMKESLIKLKGLTIAQNLKTLLKNRNKYTFDFFDVNGCIGCVCQKISTQPRERVVDIQVQEKE